MNTRELKEAVQKGACDRSFSALYGGENVERARERYASAIDTFVSIYGPKEEAFLLSVPGRSEISGNHTDHNHGRVIAASVDCDVIAVAAKEPDSLVRSRTETTLTDLGRALRKDFSGKGR